MAAEDLKIRILAQDKTKQAFSSTKRGLADVKKAVFSLKGAFVALGSAAIIKGMVDTNRQFDKMRITLRTVTGSAREADKSFDLIRDFAQNAPFSVAELTQSFIKMKALGLDPTRDTMESFANTASAMGKSFDQFTEAVADAITGEFERLKEFGIKTKQEGEKISFTFQGVTTTIGKNSKEIQEFLKSIGKVQFAGAAKAQMEGLDGAMVNLGDATDGLTDAIGRAGLNELLITIAESAASVTREITASIEAMIAGGGIMQKGAEEWSIAAEMWKGVIDGTVDFMDALTASPEDAKRIVSELRGEVGKLREDMDLMTDPVMLEELLIPADATKQFNELLKSIHKLNPEYKKAIEMAEKYTEWQRKIKEAVEEYNISAENEKILNDALAFSFNALGEAGKESAEETKTAWQEAAEAMKGSMADAITDMAMGLNSFKDTIKSVGDMIARMIIKQKIAEPIAAGISGFIGDIDFGFSHSGGIVGRDTPTRIRKYHGGGIAGDEVPAILQKGEMVLTKEQQKAVGNQVVNVTYAPQINALDPRTAATVIAQNAPTIVGVIRQAFNRNGTQVAI